MLAAFVIATCLSADDPPLAVQVRKALAAREGAFKRATWKYRTKQLPPAEQSVIEGSIQLCDGAIAYLSETPEVRRRRIESSTICWSEETSKSGKLLELAKTKPQASRFGAGAYDPAELQGLALRRKYGSLSGYLENALVEKLDGVVRFTVAETKRQRETHRYEYDFEAKPPYHLKAFRFYPGDGDMHDFFENQEFGEAAGHWFVKKGIAGTKNSAAEPFNWHAVVEISDFQPTSPPIDFVKLEAGLFNKDAAIVDEFRGIERRSTADKERQKKDLKEQIERAKGALDDAKTGKGQTYDATPQSTGPAIARWTLFGIGGAVAVGSILLWRQRGRP